MNKSWAIIGNGSFAEIVYDLLVGESFESNDHFYGFGEIIFEEEGSHILLKSHKGVEIKLNSEDSFVEGVYICIGYSQMNGIRKKVHKEILANWNNMKIKSFISRKAFIGNDVLIGEGCIIMPLAIIEPSVTIGDCSTAWFGSQVCHHTQTGKYIWIAANSTIGANCLIGNNCFFGISSTIPTGAHLADYTLLTAGAISPKKTSSESVISASGQVHNSNGKIKSTDFIRFL